MQYQRHWHTAGRVNQRFDLEHALGREQDYSIHHPALASDDQPHLRVSYAGEQGELPAEEAWQIAADVASAVMIDRVQLAPQEVFRVAERT